MQQKALVIRTYGNQELAKSMAAVMESSEMKKLHAEVEKLRAQIGTREPRDKRDFQEKMLEAKRKYTCKPMSPLKQKFWGTIGLIMVLSGVA